MKNLLKQFECNNNEAGLTILYAVITVAAVITIGVSIVGIYQRQSLLVSSSEASTRAFYAADTALECALKWDNRGENQFASSSDEIECAGDDSVFVSDSCPGDCDFYFELDDGGDANVCAEVSIEKEPTGTGDDQVIATSSDATAIYDINVGGTPYRVFEFENDGTFTVLQGGEAEFLIVAGGGGGGSRRGGGGGAGGMITDSGVVVSDDYEIEVGGGGAGGDNSGSGSPGEDSSFLGQVAIGGGYGGSSPGDDGGDGGSGGGGGRKGVGGDGTAGQGNAGGDETGGDDGAGGGGAGEPGTDDPGGVPADGGDGLQSSITGTPTWYAGGGGGDGSDGAGGLGGGGDAGGSSAENGADGLGGGGGACGFIDCPAGDGGDGIVIIRYTLSSPDDPDNPANTLIEARGRNTCQPSDRQAERALRTAY